MSWWLTGLIWRLSVTAPGGGVKYGAGIFHHAGQPKLPAAQGARDQQKWTPVLPDKRLRLSRDRALNY